MPARAANSTTGPPADQALFSPGATPSGDAPPMPRDAAEEMNTMPEILTAEGLVLPLPGPAATASLTERRVVLVKPGDLLLIGNAGNILGDPGCDAFGAFFRDVLGIRVAVFEADIDLELLPGGAAAVEPAVEDGSGG